MRTMHSHPQKEPGSESGSSSSRMVVVAAIKPERRRPHALMDRVQKDRNLHKRIGTIQAGFRKGRKPKIAEGNPDTGYSIVLGRAELQNPVPNALGELRTYCDDAREHWEELVADQSMDSPARFPHGYYEMGFSLIGAQLTNGLAEVKDRLAICFWGASTDGKLYTIRGYHEDGIVS